MKRIQRRRRRRATFAFFWIVTISTATVVIPISAAQASLQDGGGGLDDISNQLESSVFDNISSQIEDKVGGYIDGIAGNLSGIVGDVFGSIGGGGGFLDGILGNVLGPIQDTIMGHIGSFQGLITGKLDDLLGDFGLGGGGGGGGDVATGALGIPDTQQTTERILESILNSAGSTGAPGEDEQGSDKYTINPVTLSESLSNELERNQAQALAGTVLSQAGQEAMTNEIAAAQASLVAISTLATGAQSLDVTQDVMKSLIAAQGHQSMVEAGTFTQILQLRQQTAANGMVLANISEAADEETRTQRSEAMAAASTALRGAGSIYIPGFE